MAFSDILTGFIRTGGMDHLKEFSGHWEEKKIGDKISGAFSDATSKAGSAVGKAAKQFGQNMTDDKGLFQGGSTGTAFGRVKDKLSGLGPMLNNIFGKKEASEEGNLRDTAKSFDPTDASSVSDLQKEINTAGGNLKVDGIFGPETLNAVRAIQEGIDPVDAQQLDEVGIGDLDPSGNPVSVEDPSALGLSGQGVSVEDPNFTAPVAQPPQQIMDPYGFGTQQQGGMYGPMAPELQPGTGPVIMPQDPNRIPK